MKTRHQLLWGAVKSNKYADTIKCLIYSRCFGHFEMGKDMTPEEFFEIVEQELLAWKRAEEAVKGGVK